MLLGLAAVSVVVNLLQSNTGLLSVLVVIAGLPLVLAAALMWRAPQQRLVQLAAFGFAVQPLILLWRAALNALIDAIANNRDYARLPEFPISLTNAVAQFSWLFPIVAVAALAVYLGRIRTRVGWAIVGVGVVISVARAVVLISTWQPVFDDLIAAPDSSATTQLLVGSIAQMSTVAWAYVLAVADERRLTLFALGAGAAVVGTAYSIVDYLALQAVSGTGPGDPATSLISAVGALISLVSWLALIGGVVKDLPTEEASSQGALSATP